MPKVERIKEEIGWFKVLFTVCAALVASLIAWIVQNYAVAGEVTITIAVVNAIALGAVIAFAILRVSRLLSELENPQCRS